MEKEGNNVLLFQGLTESGPKGSDLPDRQTPQDNGLEARIKAVLRGVDENNLDVVASVVVSITRHQIKDRWILAGLSVITGMSVGALTLLLLMA